MSGRNGRQLRPTRRSLVRTTAGLAAAAGMGLGIGGAAESRVEAKHFSRSANNGSNQIEPFWGTHQGGITRPVQSHTYAAALDLVTTKIRRCDQVLRVWTSAAARMSSGQPAQPAGQDVASPASDSGEALDLPAARLTLTFGFGAGLFVKDGNDRYGLAAQRPPALVDLPPFNGDELIETRTGGVLSVQACADAPQVASTPCASWRGSPMARL